MLSDSGSEEVRILSRIQRGLEIALRADLAGLEERPLSHVSHSPAGRLTRVLKRASWAFTRRTAVSLSLARAYSTDAYAITRHHHECRHSLRFCAQTRVAAVLEQFERLTWRSPRRIHGVAS